MSLNVEENKETFKRLMLSNINRPGVIEMLNWLETTDFYTAPASTQYHSAEEGGLCYHSLVVLKNLMNIALRDIDKGVHPEVYASRLSSVTVTALPHDFCKIDFYTKFWRNVQVYSESGTKQDAQGRFDWQKVSSYKAEDKFPFGHGEKSVYLINKFVKLTDEEALAIRWHMGGWDNSVRGNISSMGSASEFGALVPMLQVADMLASQVDETKRED